MKQSGYLLLIAGLLLLGCQKKEEPTAAKSPDSPASSGNPLTAPVDYLGAISKAHKYAVKTIDAVALNQQVAFFQANEGRFPKDLNEMVEMKYMGALPTPPAGMQFKYDASTGSVKVVPK